MLARNDSSSAKMMRTCTAMLVRQWRVMKVHQRMDQGWRQNVTIADVGQATSVITVRAREPDYAWYTNIAMNVTI